MPEFETPDDHEAYQFFPAPAGYVNFEVRTPNDAHIALTTGPAQGVPMLEVFLGGWGNTKSIIRKNKQKPDVAEASTPSIVSPGQFRAFWIRWFNGVVTVGREGDANPFLSYQDPEPFAINFVGFATGWGAVGTWKVLDAPPSAPYAQAWQAPPPGVFPGGGAAGQGCWVPARNGEIPPQAVQGGFDGEPVYVARARFEGALLPGKLVPSRGAVYVPWGGTEHELREYEVLCASSGTWVPCSGSNIPPNAFPGGETETGEPLFIGRVSHMGSTPIGKVQQSHGVCYVPCGGKEQAYDHYEVFTL